MRGTNYNSRITDTERRMIAALNREVAAMMRISESELLSEKQSRECSDARRMAWLMLKKYTKLSLAIIAAVYDRDHASVIAGLKVIPHIIESTPEYKAKMHDLNIICERIFNGGKLWDVAFTAPVPNEVLNKVLFGL